ncbi:coiled-coil domain-containing protein 14 isoform X2 [Perca flavescens]|uniref:coiled-coil domain-containing protein 14 isoform X2 n=1 Tax=Perca flavescens TaxID=8167 RepID=UPI00106EF9B4|nr:coiled-coil domain-containing protein 14 isoform X2 [Perca flavescens]
MKGTAKSKVVTSGRLTGGVKGQLARRRVTPKPGPAACPEPAYSLYSTDSEDQVTSLHKGLDRCAALLSGILQAEKTALPGLPKAVKGGAAKSRASTSRIKKTIKNTALDQKSCPSGSTAPRTTPPSAVPAAHSQVKLRPPQLQSHVPSSPGQTLQRLPATNHPPPKPRTSVSPPQPSIPPPQPDPHSGRPPPPQTDCQAASEAPHPRCQAERDREEEFVPVRDIDTQSTAADPHAAVRHAPSHVNACTSKMSNMQLELGKVNAVPQDPHGGEERRDARSGKDCSAEKEGKCKHLLAELKALISGQGSVAERLLSHLEQTVSSPLMNAGGSSIPTAPDLSSLHSQNTRLRRRVRILNQQLKEKEKAERQQNMDTLFNSEELTLQEDLTSAQSRLQELQDDLAELRKALQDTQRRLTDREADNAVIKTDLEATRSRLLDSEREKRELASLAQQRLEEIGNLKRILQNQESLNCPPAVDSSVLDTVPTKHLNQNRHRQDPVDPPTDRITQFLMSLDQLEPGTHTEHAYAAAEREGNAPEQKKPNSVRLRDAFSHPEVRPQPGDKPEDPARHQNSHLDQSRCLDEGQSCGWRLEKKRRRALNATLSQCDVESVWSEWSARSGSTFDTRDEVAFRDGLAALDASIASLQKTIQLDLGK